ncbi:MAG TPA: hypothetical protein PKL77_10825 [Candidatus Omnitrophota bacterium]|nr:hypothetical protein [Candidatus Omnitrophota bacterium]
MNTRGLLSMTASRFCDETCDLIYNMLDPQDDGSCNVVPVTLTLAASIQPLQPIDIERLREGGIEIQSGVSIELAEALEERPERIEARGRAWRIQSWSFVKAYEDESGVPYGTVVAVCDEIRVAPAATE